MKNNKISFQALIKTILTLNNHRTLYVAQSGGAKDTWLVGMVKGPVIAAYNEKDQLITYCDSDIEKALNINDDLFSQETYELEKDGVTPGITSLL